MKNTKGRSSERLRIGFNTSSLSESSPQELNLVLGFRSSQGQGFAGRERCAVKQVNDFFHSPDLPVLVCYFISAPLHQQVGNLQVVLDRSLSLTHTFGSLVSEDSCPLHTAFILMRLRSHLIWSMAKVSQLVFPPISF